MAYVIAAPEMMAAAAADLAAIGSNVNAAHLVAAAPTVAVIPAAADEVSAGIAQVFSQHAASYQSLAGQAAAFQEQFAQNLKAGAFSYTSAEATSAGFLRDIELATAPLNPIKTNIFLNAVIVGLVTFLVLAYLDVAYNEFVTTGQILTWGAYLAEVQAGFAMGFPKFL
jgi:hypothetical protein